MRLILIAASLLLAATLGAAARAPSPVPNALAPQPAAAGPNIPKGMRQYFFGFFLRPEKKPDPIPAEKSTELLQQHLAYIRQQASAGKYSLAGPFLDDGRVRGILIINAATIDEANAIVAADPLVRAGRLAFEIHPAMLADVSCVLMEYEKNGGK